MADLSQGIVSGERMAAPAAVGERLRLIAGGLDRLGVGPGDCVAILMRNDIAFLEATYAAMTLGAYAVPINWHLKPDEARYILDDCAAKVLVGHTDLLHPLAGLLPAAEQRLPPGEGSGGVARVAGTEAGDLPQRVVYREHPELVAVHGMP